MLIKVATFNLNNLFSRWNFRGEIAAIAEGDTELESEVTYQFPDQDEYRRYRTFKGRLVKAKDPRDSKTMAERVRQFDPHVLAVQEVEDIDALKEFGRDFLEDTYPHQVLVEGNDPRLIDVGIFSKLPIGAVVSWSHLVHPGQAEEKVFSRDLLRADILSVDRTRTLFSIYNTHLKSHYVAWNDPDPEGARLASDARRQRQVESIVRVLEREHPGGVPFVVTGDMNDPPDAPCFAAFRQSSLALHDALSGARETQPGVPDDGLPDHPRWTHRFKPAGLPAQYELLDHIWLSSDLVPRLVQAVIGRRKSKNGDGSDHDPAWIELDLP